MATIDTAIDLGVPPALAYREWSRFEALPGIMGGVVAVQRVAPRRLYWRARIAGRVKEWEAELTDVRPGQRIAWRSRAGTETAGIVRFHALDRRRTRLTLHLEYEPEGTLETLGDAVGVVRRAVEADLRRFKTYVESRADLVPAA